MDQAISANTNYDPKRFEDGKVPMKVLLKDLLTAYKYGLKTLYYQNTRDGAEDSQEDLDDGCAGGACKINNFRWACFTSPPFDIFRQSIIKWVKARYK